MADVGQIGVTRTILTFCKKLFTETRQRGDLQKLAKAVSLADLTGAKPQRAPPSIGLQRSANLPQVAGSTLGSFTVRLCVTHPGGRHKDDTQNDDDDDDETRNLNRFKAPPHLQPPPRRGGRHLPNISSNLDTQFEASRLESKRADDHHWPDYLAGRRVNWRPRRLEQRRYSSITFIVFAQDTCRRMSSLLGARIGPPKAGKWPPLVPAGRYGGRKSSSLS